MRTIKRAELVKRIDRLFQACRRYDGAWEENGKWYNRCVTSGMKLPIEKIQAGHWIPRGCYATRWEPSNCNPQSAHDNLYKGGAYIEYSNWYIEKYGMAKYKHMIRLYELHKQGKQPAYKMHELKAIYDHWLAQGWELEERLDRKLFPKSWQPFGPEYML